ncbi:MAG: hypothetical protein ABJC79_03060 [Acidimicrobiia bacterium]
MTTAGTGRDHNAPARGNPRGTAGRVAVVQRQARSTLVLAAGFAVAAAAALLVPHHTGAWLPLHLFLVGTLLLAISAATQLFAVTWAAGPPPSDRAAAVQRWSLALGAALLAVARDLHWPRGVLGVGGVSVLVALVLLGISLRLIVAGGVQRRFDEAAHAYLAALASGFIGCALGIAMAIGLDSPMYARVRAAHLTFNLLGLVGLVIAGTLPFFAATQARVKMASRASPRAQRVVLSGLATSLGATAVGFLVGSSTVATFGLGGYAVFVIGIAALMPPIRMKQLRWAGPRLLQLGAGVSWWAGSAITLAWQARHGGGVFTPTVVAVLVVGGYAQILASAVAYLGPVLRAGGHQRLTAGFRTTRSWFGLGAANVAAVAFVVGAPGIAVVAIVLWVVDTAGRAALLLRTAR